MAAPIEDVSKLPGQTVNDQVGKEIGKIKDVYKVGGDDEGKPMWVTVENSTGLGEEKIIFIPLARLKQEDDEIRAPYSTQHIQNSPEVEPGDELSDEDDLRLRDYYAIGHADQELRADNESYADQVPEGEGPPQKASDESGSDAN